MGKTRPRGREAQDSEDEGPETLTLATGAEQAAQRRTEEVQQRRLAKQAEKARVAVATARQQQRQAQQQPGPGEARRAGRSAAAVPEAPAHVLEPLSEDVLAAFAERQRRHKVAGADGGGAAAGGAPGGKKRRAPKQPGQSRKAARTAAAGTTIRVNDRLAVTVRAPVEDFVASGGGGPSEAAVSFRTARLATRHKRSREMLLASRIGVAIDFGKR